MKKLSVILFAVAALVCACNKYDGAISDLQKRVDATEQNIGNLVDKVDALQRLLDAINAGVSIESVTAVEGGFTIKFSDGNSFTVVNGADGQDGEPGQDGKPGQDATISFTEDSLCYYFNFGDGNIIAVSKSGAFGIKAEATEVELESGVPTEIPFEVIGEDNTTKVFVTDCPYTYELGENKVTIAADKAADGSFIIKAVRNSDGAVSAIVITVTKKAISNVTFQFSVSDITKYGASVTVIPSNKDAKYFYSVELAETINQFEKDEDLVASLLGYWEQLYETQYSSYAPTFKEFLVKNLLYSGDVENDSWEGYLDPDTDYVALAFALDEETLALLSTTVGKSEFTTLPEEGLSDVTYLGVATWHECLVGDIYSIPASDFPVDVYEDNIMPGVFYFDSPYCAENVMSWFGETDPSQLSNNCLKTYISIDASNPDSVVFPFQELGIQLNPSYGWASAGSTYGGSIISTGTYANGVISFTGEFKWGESRDPGPYSTNISGAFKITMPNGSNAPTKAPAAKKEAKPVLSQGKKLVEIHSISK